MIYPFKSPVEVLLAYRLFNEFYTESFQDGDKLIRGREEEGSTLFVSGTYRGKHLELELTEDDIIKIHSLNKTNLEKLAEQIKIDLITLSRQISIDQYVEQEIEDEKISKRIYKVLKIIKSKAV